MLLISVLSAPTWKAPLFFSKMSSQTQNEASQAFEQNSQAFIEDEPASPPLIAPPSPPTRFASPDASQSLLEGEEEAQDYPSPGGYIVTAAAAATTAATAAAIGVAKR